MKTGDLVASTLDGEIGIITEVVPCPTTSKISYRVWWGHSEAGPWSLEPEGTDDVRCVDESR